MCVTALTEFRFACSIICDRWGNIFPRFGYDLINYPETLPNKDQIKGRVEETKGKAKEVVGVMLDEVGMEIEGIVQKNVVKVQAGFGDLKEDH